eukprot:gene28935-biopygen32812
MKDKEGFIPSDQRLLGAVNVAAFLLIITATLLSLGYLEFASPQPEGQTATEARRWGLSGNTDHSKAYGHVVKNIADHSLIKEALEYQRTGIPLHQYLDHLRELQRSELEISTDLDALNWEEADTIETFFKRGKLLYSEMRSAHSGDAGPSGSSINMTSIDPSSLAMFVSDAVRNEVQQSLQSFRARNGNKGGNSGGTSSVNRGGYGNGNRGGSGNRNGNQSENESRGYGGGRGNGRGRGRSSSGRNSCNTWNGFTKRPQLDHRELQLAPLGSSGMLDLAMLSQPDKLSARGAEGRLVGYVPGSTSMYQVNLPDKRKVITARHCEFLEEDNQIPRIPDASDPGPACKKRNSKDEVYPSRILLCDCIGCSHCKPNAGSETSTCDAAWHMACLPDPLFKLPRRNWLCPDCTKTPETQPGQVSSLETLEPFLEDPDPILLPDPPATNATNVSKRGRVRRSPVVYNPVFLSMMVLDDIVNSTVAGTSAAGVPPDPSSLSEAMASHERDGWLDATVSEVCSLLEKGTFRVVDKPDRPVVSTKWVFKRKVDAFGNYQLG